MGTNPSETFAARVLFVGPAAIIAVAIVLPPLIYVLVTSLQFPQPSFDAFRDVVGSSLFRQSLATTIYLSGLSTFFSVLLGYIIATHLARQSPSRRNVLMLLVLLPMWTSVLVKSFAFTIILGREGIINSFLGWLTNGSLQVPLLFNWFSIIVGMASYLVPLTVTPLLASLLSIDNSLYRAASISGARPMRIFFTVTLPLSLAGIVAASITAFVLSLGAFVIPALLGGSRDMMLSNVIDFYNREILDWPRAAAISVILLAMAITIALPLLLGRTKKT